MLTIFHKWADNRRVWVNKTYLDSKEVKEQLVAHDTQPCGYFTATYNTAKCERVPRASRSKFEFENRAKTIRTIILPAAENRPFSFAFLLVIILKSKPNGTLQLHDN